MLKMYLCGAIRDNELVDLEWREQLINTLTPYMDEGILSILNPCGGKSRVNGRWFIQQLPSDGRHLVSQDYWCVDRSDIIVANLTALERGYPCIGSLMELGRSTASEKLRYLVLPRGYKGHMNGDMFNLHPFLSRSATAVFHDVNDCIKFLADHVPVLAGVEPSFIGIKDEPNAVHQSGQEAEARPDLAGVTTAG